MKNFLKSCVICLGLFTGYFSLYGQRNTLTSKDSTYQGNGISFIFPKDNTWKIGIIQIDGSSWDTLFARRLDHEKITLFPDNGNSPVYLTIERNEFRLISDVKTYIQSLLAAEESITLLDTSSFKHHGILVFETVSRWQEMETSPYSFERKWFMIDKNKMISTLSYAGVSAWYFKYLGKAKQIMRSVRFDD